MNRALIQLGGCCVFSLAALLAAETKLGIDRPIYPGDRVISGYGADKKAEVEIYVNLRRVKTVAPREDGTFETEPLDRPLVSGNVVQIKQTIDGKEILSEPENVSAQAPLPPAVTSPLACGATVIEGRLGVASPAARLRVLVNNMEAQKSVSVEAGGVFRAELRQALQGGNVVSVRQLAGGQTLETGSLTVKPCQGPAAVKLVPPVIDTPKEGAKEISGSVPTDEGAVTVKVNGVVAGKPKPVNGRWKVEYDSGLKANMFIEVEHRVDHVEPQTRRASAVVEASQAQPPLIELYRVAEGDSTITGRVVLPAAKEVKQVKVEIRRDADRQVQTALFVEPDSKGAFTAQPAVSLAESMLVVAVGLNEKAQPVDRAAAVRTVDSALFDWGRASSYFSLGANFARSNGDFGDPQVYLGFTLDVNVYNSRKDQPTRPQRLASNLSSGDVGGDLGRLNIRRKAVEDRIKSLAPSKEKSGGMTAKQACEGIRRGSAESGTSTALPELCREFHALKNQPEGGILFNTYFDGRLTQAGVVSTEGRLQAPTIVQQNNSGFIELGGYMPWYTGWSSWNFRGQDQAIFAAPIVKAGFVALSSEDLQARAEVLRTNNGVYALNPSDVYRQLHGGVRFGHMHLSASGNVMPELVSYIDLTVGRFDNYRKPKPDVEPSYGAGFVSPARFEIHGRAKIPQTPLTIGFTINTGSGPDDYQLFVGSRFDATKFLKKLLPGTP